MIALPLLAFVVWLWWEFPLPMLALALFWGAFELLAWVSDRLYDPPRENRR